MSLYSITICYTANIMVGRMTIGWIEEFIRDGVAVESPNNNSLPCVII